MMISTPEWVKDAIFYQIFPDRFAQGKKVSKTGLHLETWDSAPSAYGFKGGDLWGVTEHLDYLQDMGINAIYLNPIFSSASYHRYHTYDYYAVDPLLGGNSAFKKLLDAAHRRDMRVILDGVFNHASRGFWQFHHVLEIGDASPYVDWFFFNPDRLNHQKHWGAYPTQEEENTLRYGVSSYDAIGYRAWWNIPALPKFNTETPAVREFLWNVAEYWIKFGIDGWRLDVPNEIDNDAFWEEFRQRVKSINPQAYIVGEIWHEGQRWLQGNQFDAIMNYMLTGALLGFLVGDRLDQSLFQVGDYSKYVRPLDAASFADRINYLLSLYPTEINQAQLNLLDDHDTPRFLTTACGDISALQLGWLFLFTFPGAPCVYYGDEIGLDGGRDPENRKAFPWSKKVWNKTLLNDLKSLIALRKAHPALRRGSFITLSAANGIYAFSRSLENEKLVVIINASTQTQTCNLPGDQVGNPTGNPEVLFGAIKFSAPNNQKNTFELAPRSGVVLKV